MRKQIALIITTTCFVIGWLAGDKLITSRRK